MSRWRWAAVMLAAVGGLSACEGMPPTANPEVPLWFHHPGGALSVTMRREITIEGRKEGEAYERAVPAIDAAHRRVFVGSRDHGMYALDAVDGDRLWRFETAGAVQSEPLYDPGSDVLYFGSNDGAVYCLRAADGHMLWRFAMATEVVRRPVLYRGTLYVVDASDYLVAIDAVTGKLRWYQHHPPALGMEISGYAGPAIHGDTVYAAYSDGVVMAYAAADGAERWPALVDLTAEAEQTRGGEELRYLDVDTTPVVAPGAGPEGQALVYVASYEGGMYALDAATGSQAWANDAAVGVTELILWDHPVRPPSLAAPGGLAAGVVAPAEAESAEARSLESSGPAAGRHARLIASSGLTGLWAIDPRSGKKLWRRDLPNGGVTMAQPWGGALLVGTTRYGVFLVSPLNGGVIDGLHSGGSFAAAPATYGMRAFILSNDGVLFGLGLRRPPTADRRYRDSLLR